MNVFEKSVFWITFFTLQSLRCCYADPDGGEGYYYSVEYEPLNYTPGNDEQYPGGRAGEASNDAGGDCHHAMDLALMFDSSYTVTSDGWKTIKEAAKNMTNNLDVSPDGTHVSILVYSTNVDDYYLFDRSADRRKISNLIDGMNYYGEWSRLDRALSALPHNVFSPFNGARSGVPKVVVVFTDGKLEGPSEKPGTQPDLLKSLARSVENLRREDVVIYGVSTGASDNKVFDLIAGDKSRIIDINNIDQLVNSMLKIGMKICKGHEEQTLKKYASSSPVVASIATMTSTVNITVTVTAGEPLLSTPPVRLTSATRFVEVSKSTMPLSPKPSSPSNQVPFSEVKSQSLTPATISLTLAPSTSNSLSFTPANRHTSTTQTPTGTTSATPQSQVASTGSVSFTAGGSLSLTPSSQTLPATGTVEASVPVSTTPLFPGPSSTGLSLAGASLSTTQPNQPTSLSQTATTGTSLPPSASSMETTSAAEVSSASAALALTTTLSSIGFSLTVTATTGQSFSAPSSAPSTTSISLTPTPSSYSTSSIETTAAASESMTPTTSSQTTSTILATPASESFSSTPSLTETGGTSSIITSNQPVSATAGTVTVTVTVTVTPTSQVLASPVKKSGKGF